MSLDIIAALNKYVADNPGQMVPSVARALGVPVREVVALVNAGDSVGVFVEGIASGSAVTAPILLYPVQP